MFSILKFNLHKIFYFQFLITPNRYKILCICCFSGTYSYMYILRINVDTRKSWGLFQRHAVAVKLTTAVPVNSCVAHYNVAQQGRRRVAVNRNQFNAACMLQLRNEFAKCGARSCLREYVPARLRTPQSRKRAKGKKEIKRGGREKEREIEGEMDDEKVERRREGIERADRLAFISGL